MEIIPDEIDKLFARLEREEFVKEDDIVEIELYNGEFVRSDDKRLIQLDSGLHALQDDLDLFTFDNKFWIYGDEQIAIDERTSDYTYVKDLNWGYIDETEFNYFSDGIYVEETNSYYYDENVLSLHGYQIINEEIKAITNESLSEFESILQSIYPDRWEIKRYDNLLSTCYIYFPEITIINSNNNSHEIKDLYIYFQFITKTLKFYNSFFQGFRTTVTQSELSTDYGHSHLGGLNGSSFCMGEGPIKLIIIDLYREYNSQLFEAFLLNLDEYLKWESLEGTPHRYLEKLNNLDVIKDLQTSNNFSKSQEFLNQLEEFYLKISEDGVRLLEPDFNDIEIRLSQWFIENNYREFLVRKDIDTNRYYQDRSIDTSRDFTIPINHFKEKLLVKNILKDKKETKLPYYANPNYTNYICGRIKQEINKFYFNNRNASES